MSDERLSHLEERFAWLERRVVEQDKVMLQFWEEVRNLRQELRRLGEKAPVAQSGEDPGLDERPPHY